MKVLVIAQEIDEEGSILGFFVEWVRQLSQHFDELDVAYFKGSGAKMPKNVNLHKIEGNKVSKTLKLNELVLKRTPDKVFVHMCPEFVVAIGAVCKAKEIPIIFWRESGVGNLFLNSATLLSDKIVGASKEGFAIKTKKRKALGHGIDVRSYVGGVGRYILDVGRIARIKHHDITIKALSRVQKTHPNLKLWIVGGETNSGKGMLNELKCLAKQNSVGKGIKFLGTVPHKKMSRIYSDCIIFISASTTGSLDKTVLEAMASAKPVLVCRAFSEVLEGYEDRLFFKPGDANELAEKINFLLENKEIRKKIGSGLRKRVEKEHSLNKLISKIATEIKTTR